jgi:hypothetical protein
MPAFLSLEESNATEMNTLNIKTQVLMVSPEAWDGHFVSKHHYAVTLAAQGIGVYFLNPPDSNLSAIKISPTAYDHLWVIDAPIVSKGLRFYPEKWRRWLESSWLQKLEAQIGGAFSTIWLFENSRFFNMAFAGKRLKIYHQVDLNQNFHVQAAAHSADICFCTTDFIRQALQPHCRHVYKIHHAVAAYQHKPELTPAQKNNFSTEKVNAVYVGNLDIPYLDTALLASLVDRFPQVQFHLVGQYQQGNPLYQAFAHQNNLTWWGAVKADQIPVILSHCQVELLIYKANNVWEQQQLASPHKLMEYIASGKVIVATYTDEYKDKRHLLEMVDDTKDFLATFESVTNNLAYHNSPEKQAERMAFAQANTYSEQLNTMIIPRLNQHGFHL